MTWLNDIDFAELQTKYNEMYPSVMAALRRQPVELTEDIVVYLTSPQRKKWFIEQFGFDPWMITVEEMKYMLNKDLPR